MQHPVLDAFDRLIASLGFLKTPGSPICVLLFSPTCAPVLLAKEGTHGTMVSIAQLPRTGHRALEVYRETEKALEAAATFQRSLHMVPGLPALFGQSAVAIGATDLHAPDPILLLDWWPVSDLRALSQGTMETLGHIFPHEFRLALAKAVALSTVRRPVPVPCSVMEYHFEREGCMLDVDPAWLDIFLPLVLPHSAQQGHVGLNRRFVRIEAPPTIPAPDVARRAEISRVEEAYARLVGAVQQRPPTVEKVTLSANPASCYFLTQDDGLLLLSDDGTDGHASTDTPFANLSPAMRDHPAAGWMEVLLSAWHGFLASFPAGRHWAHAQPLLDAYDAHKYTHGAQHVPRSTHWGISLHRTPWGMPFEVTQIEAWLTPTMGKPFFVQTHEDHLVHRVDAEDDAGALALACRFSPPRDGFPVTVSLWDMWVSDHPLAEPAPRSTSSG